MYKRNKTKYREIKRWYALRAGRPWLRSTGKLATQIHRLEFALQKQKEELASMRRRDFFKGSAAMAGALTIGDSRTQAMVRAHNWEKYEFGSGPVVTDRLNQGPFPQYPPDAAIPGDEVVMATTPSDDVVPNFGKGLITYVTADMGTDEIKGDNLSQAIEELVQFPLGQQLYIRPTWREVQPRPGRLEMPEYLKDRKSVV